jgi:hypothetical protein
MIYSADAGNGFAGWNLQLTWSFYLHDSFDFGFGLSIQMPLTVTR